jgi:hypothetical protein
MPPSAPARLDDAQAALASLREEERRLARLGLREALRRCREQLRYWEFLAALFSLPASPQRHLPATRRGH